MAKVNPNFSSELKKIGADDFSACFNCGDCTATCSFSTSDTSFPRKMVRYSVLGLEEDIQSSVDPWLCYYCGDCSTSCPRQADPGNLMMSLRRYLVSKYDWTGLSKKLYTSKVWELGAIAVIASIVLLLFIVKGGEMTTQLTDQGGVNINSFAPWQSVEMLDWLMAGLLSFFLISNIFNMFYKIVLKQKEVKIPMKLYFKELYNLIFHFSTQWDFSKCDTEKISIWSKIKNGNYNYWIIHFLLMTSYVTMFIMIVGFLGWFQTDHIYSWYHPQRLLGYYATFGLITGILYFSALRFNKITEKTKKTHFTDWTFLILLFLTTLSGILLHFFRINGAAYATYYTYVIHMMVLVPMLMIEVPFSKWSHLAYRPFAIYFSRLIISTKNIKK